jgi:hypothetical protein
MFAIVRIRPYIISGLALLLVPSILDGQNQSAGVEQRSVGYRAPAELIESFDGLGADLFAISPPRNPSDNSLAVGPDHIMQTVNSQLVVFTKKGKRFDTAGKVLYGPIATNTAFAGFGGVCEARPNGDAVVRYDQLAGRWLVVMPIFRRVGPGRGSTSSTQGQIPTLCVPVNWRSLGKPHSQAMPHRSGRHRRFHQLQLAGKVLLHPRRRRQVRMRS